MCLCSTVKAVGVHEKLKQVGLLKKNSNSLLFYPRFCPSLYLNSSCQKISNVFQLFWVLCVFLLLQIIGTLKWVILCSLVMSFFGLLLGIFWTKPNVQVSSLVSQSS